MTGLSDENRALVVRLSAWANSLDRIGEPRRAADLRSAIEALAARSGDRWVGSPSKRDAALLDALEALITTCEWFGQREAGEDTTNSEAAIFQRLSNVAARIEGGFGLSLAARAEASTPRSDGVGGDGGQPEPTGDRPQMADLGAEPSALAVILAWYQTLPPRARAGMSLENLHNLRKALAKGGA